MQLIEVIRLKGCIGNLSKKLMKDKTFNSSERFVLHTPDEGRNL